MRLGSWSDDWEPASVVVVTSDLRLMYWTLQLIDVAILLLLAGLRPVD